MAWVWGLGQRLVAGLLTIPVPAEPNSLFASLEDRTGRSLAEWMRYLDYLAFEDRRDAIAYMQADDLTLAEALMLEHQHSTSRNVADETRHKPPMRLAPGSAVTARQAAQVARQHAAELLAHLQNLHAGEEVLARDCEAIYIGFCDKRGCAPVRWSHKNGVGHHLRGLLGGSKPYRDVVGASGRRQRLCVYAIPVPTREPAREPTPVRPIRHRHAKADVTPTSIPVAAAA